MNVRVDGCTSTWLLPVMDTVTKAEGSSKRPLCSAGILLSTTVYVSLDTISVAITSDFEINTDAMSLS